MRVALACPYAWDAPGGVQVHIRQLSEHLRRRGHETLVLAPSSDDQPEPGVVHVGRPVRVPFNGSVAPICPDPRSRKRIREALESFRPDVVHAHEPFAPSTGFFATLEADVPVVAVSHAYMDRSVLFAGFSRAFRRVWDRPALWLAVSQAALGFLKRHVRANVRARVVPNGVDVEPFRHAAPIDLPPGRHMLFVGRLEPRKGFRTAVEAFALLAREYSDLSLTVVGDGPERRALSLLPDDVEDRVTMAGMVPHLKLPSYHAAADLFVAPSTGRESFGIVLVEAMAAGLPVIASDIPGYREVVRNGVDGLLVERENPGALADAVRGVLSDSALAERLRAAGRARAERFRWEVVSVEVEAAYHDALRFAGG
ncbi:MAG TPA: glycosyltransferase family 4 protein [Actinomycetota bacterium]